MPGNCNLPVGLFPDAAYVSDVLQLLPGERLLIPTDGVTESEDAAAEMFGEGRFQGADYGGGNVKRDVPGDLRLLPRVSRRRTTARWWKCGSRLLRDAVTERVRLLHAGRRGNAVHAQVFDDLAVVVEAVGDETAGEAGARVGFVDAFEGVLFGEVGHGLVGEDKGSV